jgi:hypothetical protein
MQTNKHKEDRFEAQDDTNLFIQLGKTNIKSLKLPKQIVSALMQAGLTTIADVALLSPRELSLIKRVGMKSVTKIQKALNRALNSPADYIKAASLEDLQKQSPKTWAEIIEPFLRTETETRMYVFISRFGFHQKKLQELATELKISRERVRQIEELAAKRLVKHARSPGYITIVDRIIKIVSHGKEDLSLLSLKSILTEKGILGKFSKPIKFKGYDADPFEILVGWLEVLSDSRFTHPRQVFPIQIGDLREAASLSIREYKALQKKLPYNQF